MNRHEPSTKAVAAWLLVCCATLFALIVVGGITRLTHSGLSIVEWQPIVGAVPPLTDAAWQEAFSQYQRTPEYRTVNFGMSLSEFKSIFWWEYVHRLLARGLGVLFFVPFLYFLMRRKISAALGVKLGVILLLGGLQGALGWYMVASGLVDEPRVSQFRLTAHLGLAVMIYAAMLWTALDLLAPRSPAAAGGALRSAQHASTLIAAAVFVAVLSGGLVAGTRAGLAYSTFPLMNGHWIPAEAVMLDPWYSNFFYNLATVQLDHRFMVWLLALAVPWFCYKLWRVAPNPRARVVCVLLLATLALQVILGIATLLLAVPVALAAAHQAGALLVVSAALLAAHELRRRAARGGASGPTCIRALTCAGARSDKAA